MRRTLRIAAPSAAALFAGIAVAAVVACSKGSDDAPAADGGVYDHATEPSTPFTDAEMRAASVAYFTVVCPTMQACDDTTFQYVFGTIDRCVGADVPTADLATLFPYGSSLTPAKLTACAAKISLPDCDAFARFAFEAQIPDECQDIAKGTLPNGAPCSATGILGMPFSHQCASSRCIADLDGCGTCKAPAPAGAPCTHYVDCEQGTTCVASGSQAVCVPQSERGGSCDGQTRVCRGFDDCVDGKCVAHSTTCDPKVGCTGTQAGLSCDPTTRLCSLHFASIGQPCVNSASNQVPCAAGLTCEHVQADGGVDGAAFDPANGVCVPVLADGTPCADERYPFGDECERDNLHVSACIFDRCTDLEPSACSPAGSP